MFSLGLEHMGVEMHLFVAQRNWFQLLLKIVIEITKFSICSDREATGGIYQNLAKLSKLKNTKEVPGKGNHPHKTTEYGKIKCLAVKEHVRNR